MVEEKLSRACMKCGSTNLSLPQTAWKIKAGILNEYKCKDCGFEGQTVKGNKKFIQALKNKNN